MGMCNEAPRACLLRESDIPTTPFGFHALFLKAYFSKIGNTQQKQRILYSRNRDIQKNSHWMYPATAEHLLFH